MVALLFLLCFSEIKNTGQASQNGIMAHFSAHWVVSVTLIGSGVCCWVKYTVNTTKCHLKISFTEKHVGFLRRMNGKFPCFSSDAFLDLSFQVLLFRLETLNLEVVKWFCFFTEIKTHTSVDENLSIFRKKFEWKFFRFCNGLIWLLFHTGTELMKYRETDCLCPIPGCSQNRNCRKSHNKSMSCRTSSPPAYSNKPLDFPKPNLDPESFVVGSWRMKK